MTKHKELIHYSSKPLLFNNKMDYKQYYRRKPRGFWLSVNEYHKNTWKQWCKSADFRIDSLKYVTKFKVDLTNVLVIENESDLNRLDNKYTLLYEGGGHNRIDWDKVKKDYSGIFIDKYNGKRYDSNKWKETEYYYYWDCSSACIWDLNILTIKE